MRLVSIPISMLALAACTVPNPAYRADGGDEAGPGAQTTGTESTGSLPTSGDEPTGAMACELGPAQPLTITVALDGVAVEPECPGGGTIRSYPLGSNIFPITWNTVVHELCEPAMCDCPENPPELTIELADDAAFAEGVHLPDCGRVDLWSRMGPERCEWAGVVLWEQGLDGVPVYIASRTLDVPPFTMAEVPFMLRMDGDELCTHLEACADDRFAGRYALDVLGLDVTMDQAPPLIALPFGASGGTLTYLFDNRMAMITRECEPQVAWTAQLWN